MHEQSPLLGGSDGESSCRWPSITLAILVMCTMKPVSADRTTMSVERRMVDPVRRLSLDGTWMLTQTGGAVPGRAPFSPCPASVPGSVPDALHHSGQMPDPTFGKNQLEVLNYSTALNFTYTTMVNMPLACRSRATLCELQFDGIDTAAEVRWSGEVIGTTNNMFRRYTFPVTGSGAIKLEVEIEPATVYGAKVAASTGDPGCQKHNRGLGPGSWPEKWGHGTVCSTYVRKNTGSFGWDCAPAFVSSGIWKSVTLRLTPRGTATIDAIVPRVRSLLAPNALIYDGNNSFSVDVRVMYTTSGPFAGVLEVRGEWMASGPASLHVNPTSAGQHEATLTIAATNINLWWPHGTHPSGAKDRAMLYSLTTSFVPEGSNSSSDSANASLGFRTFAFVGSVGNSTAKFNQAPLFFRVNGRAVYAKGFNWMPSFVLPADTDADKADKIARLEDAHRVGSNTVRVWGGGLYESETFYSTADALGLMIMQDGSFFGMSYPTFPNFFENVRLEMESNMYRLARHPSLMVVSGNNEATVYSNEPLYVETELSTVAGSNLNVEVYPSCPSYGWSSTSPQLVPRPQAPKSKDNNAGGILCREGDKIVECPHDTHYYGPCGTIPLGTNMGTEFGWPSADLIDVLDKVTPPGQNMLRPNGSSPFLDYRSQIKNPLWTVDSMLYPNSTMSALLPSLLSTHDTDRAAMARWLYLTQVLQAHCVGTSITTYRQHSFVMASLNWALNSIWTGPAWGATSHDGSWKVLMYRLSHVFSDTLLSFNYPTPPNNYRVLPQPSSCPIGSVCLHISKHSLGQAQYFCSIEARDYKTGGVQGSDTFNTSLPKEQPIGTDVYAAEISKWFSQRAPACSSTGLNCYFTAQCTIHSNNGTSRVISSQPYFWGSLATAVGLGPAKLSVQVTRVDVDKLDISVSTNTTTPFVFIAADIPNIVFSDNAQTLLPGEDFNVSCSTRDGSPLDIDVFKSLLQIYCINNKYAIKPFS